MQKVPGQRNDNMNQLARYLSIILLSAFALTLSGCDWNFLDSEDGNSGSSSSQNNQPPGDSTPDTPKPKAAFTTSGDKTAGVILHFNASSSTGNGLSYAWTFGDNATAKGKTTTHKYAAAGNYTVKLTVTDKNGKKDTHSKTLSIAPPAVAPVAGFSVTGPKQAGKVLAFDASSSIGNGLSYAWSFGDGATATGKTASHKYVSKGSYTVTLTVVDNNSKQDYSSITLTIAPDGTTAPAIKAAFSVSGTQQVGNTVSFDGGSSTGTGLSYAWDFGDGTSGSGETATHKYTAAASYTVKLTVTDKNGIKDSVTHAVTIAALPTAGFQVQGTQEVGQALTFDASSATGSGLTYRWDFGDGQTATGNIASHSYTAAGDYTVRLTVTDSLGSKGSTSKTLTIATAAPKARFSTPDTGKAGQPHSFDASSSTGDGLTYFWDFGDGDAGSRANIAHVYDSAGQYTVKLTVTDDAGRTASSSKPLTIAKADAQPVAKNGSISGTVTDAEGNPLQGVVVSLLNATDLAGGNRSATTDADGKVSLADMPAGIEFALALTKQGYAVQLVRTNIPDGSTDALFKASLIQRAAAKTLSNAEAGGTVTGTDGASIQLPANALVDGNGNPVTGTVNVSLTPVDVSKDAQLTAFPGSFAAYNSTGENGLMLSYGVAEFELTQAGKELQIAPGKQATIHIPIYVTKHQDGSPIALGDSIPLWSLDETTGQWIQEGTGTVVADASSPTGMAFEAKVGHLSWYNCDQFSNPYRPIPHCTVSNNSSVPTLDLSETCYIEGHIAGDGPRTRVTTTVPAGGGKPLPVPSNVDYVLTGFARNGTLSGSITVNGARDTQGVVEIVLTEVGSGVGDGTPIILPYDNTGTIDSADTPDIFEFDVQSGEHVYAVVEPASGSTLAGEVTIRNATGQVVAQSAFGSGNPALLTAADTDGGTYSITVDGTANIPGGYHIHVAINTVTELTLPVEHSDTLEDSVDTYRFTGQAGKYLAIHVRPQDGISNVGGEVVLKDAAGTLVDSAIISRHDEGVILTRMDSSADYTLTVRGSYQKSDSYTLQAYVVPAITINQNLVGTVRYFGYKVFTGTAGELVAVYNSSGSTSVQLLDAAGAELPDSLYFNYFNGSVYKLPYDGQYLLELHGDSNGGTSAYRTAVASIETAQSLSFDAAGRAVTNDEILQYGDVKVYQFTATAGDGVFIRIDGAGSDPIDTDEAYLSVYRQGATLGLVNLDEIGSEDGFENTNPTHIISYGMKLEGLGTQPETYWLLFTTEEDPGDQPAQNPGQTSLGGYTLRVDVAHAADTIVVDDDLQQCSGADTYSLHAAAFAVADGGTLDVCAGLYAENRPITRTYRTGKGFDIIGRNRAAVVLSTDAAGREVVSFGTRSNHNSVENGISLQDLTVQTDSTGQRYGTYLSVASLTNVTVEPVPGTDTTASTIVVKLDGSVIDGLVAEDQQVLVQRADNVTIKNSTLSGTNVQISADKSNGLVIQGNTLSGVSDGNVVSVGGSGAQLLGNTISVSGKGVYNPWDSSMVSIRDTDSNNADTIIRGNTLVGPAGGLNLEVGHNDFVIEQNLFKSTSADGYGGQALVMFGTSSSILPAVLVRNNVFIGVTGFDGGAVSIHSPARFEHVDIINNSWQAVVPDPAASAPRCNGCAMLDIGKYNSNLEGTGPLPIRFINNIMTGWATYSTTDVIAVDMPTGTSIDSNNNLFNGFDIYYGNGGTSTGNEDIKGVATGTAIFAVGSTTLELDPSSPAVNNGQGTMSGGAPVPLLDYDGTARPQGSTWDIGAHEYEQQP